MEVITLSILVLLFSDEEEATVSATDVIANNISISAPSRQLLIDASLKLVGGRRYGLLGPNGRYCTLFSAHFRNNSIDNSLL